jgi:hypothetical protein
LYLANNPLVGDLSIESLFISINKGNNLSELNLSNCSIGNCEWARFLPFFKSLKQLDLSYNRITDDEFVKLCKGLERCSSLNSLDISHNRFGGLKCNVIQQLLEQNCALHTFSLRGNRCQDSIWDAIHKGLLSNSTLLDLNLSECDVRVNNFNVLCLAFMKNDVCTISLDNNPLSPEIIVDPREYARQKFSIQVHQIGSSSLLEESICESIGSGQPKKLNQFAHSISIERSKQWCDALSKEVSLSLNTLSIIAEHKEKEIEKTKLAESLSRFGFTGRHFMSEDLSQSSPRNGFSGYQQQPTGSVGEFGVTEEPSSSQILSLTLSNSNSEYYANGSVSGAGGSRSRVSRADSQVPVVSAAFMTDPDIIAQSNFYDSVATLQHIVSRSDQANTAEVRTMHVAYGRAPLVIGSIDITSLTTYAEAHAMVAPLVHEYVATVASTASALLVDKYGLFDVNGTTLTQEAMQLRRVWPEFFNEAEPVLIVRPGNWKQLS